MTIQEQYLAAYNRATRALDGINVAIHDMPAPESEGVTWGNVADMQRIARELESVQKIAEYTA